MYERWPAIREELSPQVIEQIKQNLFEASDGQVPVAVLWDGDGPNIRKKKVYLFFGDEAAILTAIAENKWWDIKSEKFARSRQHVSVIAQIVPMLWPGAHIFWSPCSCCSVSDFRTSYPDYEQVPARQKVT